MNKQSSHGGQGWKNEFVQTPDLFDPMDQYRKNPLQSIKPETVGAVVLFDTMKNTVFDGKGGSVGIGDTLPGVVLLKPLTERFPGKPIYLITQYPKLWEGIENVHPIHENDSGERIKKLSREIADDKKIVLIDPYNNVPQPLFSIKIDHPGKISITRQSHVDPFIVHKHTGSVETYVNCGMGGKRVSVEGERGEIIQSPPNLYLSNQFFSGILGAPTNETIPRIRISPEESKKARETLRAWGVDVDNDMLHIVAAISGVSWASEKQLDVDKNHKIFQALLEGDETDVWVNRGREKQSNERALELGKRMHGEGNGKHFFTIPPGTGEFPVDLREYTAIMNEADLVFTVDTGDSHIAPTLGKPTLIYYPQLEYNTPYESMYLRQKRGLFDGKVYSSGNSEIYKPISPHTYVIDPPECPSANAIPVDVILSGVRAMKLLARGKSIEVFTKPDEARELSRGLFEKTKQLAMDKGYGGTDIWYGIEDDYEKIAGCMDSEYAKFLCPPNWGGINESRRFVGSLNLGFAKVSWENSNLMNYLRATFKNDNSHA